MVALPSVKLRALSLLSLPPPFLSPHGSFNPRSSIVSPPTPLSLSSPLFLSLRLSFTLSLCTCVQGCIDRCRTLMCFLRKIHLRSHKLATETDASHPLAAAVQAAPIQPGPSRVLERRSKAARRDRASAAYMYLRRIPRNCSEAVTGVRGALAP